MFAVLITQNFTCTSKAKNFTLAYPKFYKANIIPKILIKKSIPESYFYQPYTQKCIKIKIKYRFHQES